MTANNKLADHAGNAECEDKQRINKDKGSAAILARKVRKAPDVA